MTPEQFEKLPKFAKDEIVALRSKVKSLVDESNQFHFPGATPITWRSEGESHGLPNRATVEFSLGGEDCDKVEVSIRNGHIVVRGGSRLIIYPEVSNVVRIGVEK